jgi:MYXO-CTERM domain-containing protein
MTRRRAASPYLRALLETERRACLGGWLALALIACTIALSSICAEGAHADGDPASDILLAQGAYYPYNLPSDRALEAAMNKALSESARAGLSLKVAVISSPIDLGLDPRFFGHPQQYAEYLDKEIAFNERPRLLVLMPQGFGRVAVFDHGALARVKIDSRDSAALVRSAILAVVALARANGHKIALPSIPTGSSSSGPPSIVYAAPVLALLVVGLLVGRRGRRRPQ